MKRDSTDHTESFGDITYNAGDAEYTYYVTENLGKITALHYSQAKYKVVVTVSKKRCRQVGFCRDVRDQGAGRQWQDGSRIAERQYATGRFHQHYIAVSALPLTGGMTDRQWLFVGGAVGGLAVLLIGAAGVWNGKKRLV